MYVAPINPILIILVRTWILTIRNKVYIIYFVHTQTKWEIKLIWSVPTDIHTFISSNIKNPGTTEIQGPLAIPNIARQNQQTLRARNQ